MLAAVSWCCRTSLILSIIENRMWRIALASFCLNNLRFIVNVLSSSALLRIASASSKATLGTIDSLFIFFARRITSECSSSARSL